MADFCADHPFAEVTLKVASADFCEVGDIIAGMKGGQGRVEKRLDGAVVVHPVKEGMFWVGDVLISPTGVTEIVGVG